MSEDNFLDLQTCRYIADWSAYGMISAGIITFIFAVSTGLLGAGYGRHYKKGNKRDLSDIGVLFSFKNGWIIQESGSVLSSLAVLLFVYNSSPTLLSFHQFVYLVPFYIHYIHRAWIYPFFTNSNNPISCSIMSLALIFCSWNGFQQTMSAIGYSEDENGLVKPNYIGIPVFVIGMLTNMHADYHLIGLKKQGNGYQIPKVGLFRFITCPNYFGEFVEWFGYSIFCNFSLSSIAFVIFTMGNLVPRAIKNHRWYLEKFPQDYPKSRKIVFPFIY